MGGYPEVGFGLRREIEVPEFGRVGFPAVNIAPVAELPVGAPFNYAVAAPFTEGRFGAYRDIEVPEFGRVGFPADDYAPVAEVPYGVAGYPVGEFVDYAVAAPYAGVAEIPVATEWNGLGFGTEYGYYGDVARAAEWDTLGYDVAIDPTYPYSDVYGYGAWSSPIEEPYLEIPNIEWVQ